LKVYAAATLVAVVFWIAPPAAFAQRSGASRGSRAANPRSGEPPARVETGQLLPGTPGSAYRSRLEPRPFTDRGVRRRSLSYWWWGLTYGDYLDLPNDTSRAEDLTPAPPRRIEPPAESSLIQPMLTLARPQAPQMAHGNLQLEVVPNTAQAYVDGFYVGTVEDVSHLAGGLTVGAGWHRLEFRAPGYVTPAVNVTIEANRTFTYRGELKPIVR
jgi:hypothetical protein